MNNQNLVELIRSQIKKNSTQYKVFTLLSDQKWHCRDCEGKQIKSGQYAGDSLNQKLVEIQRKN